MIAGLHTGSHFRKLFNGTLPPLALIAICLLPLLVGGLFVWSYWDPLGNLDKIPVALVNSDEGAEGPDGEERNAGNEVTEKLLELEPMNFVEVSPEEARQGIAEGRFYLGGDPQGLLRSLHQCEHGQPASGENQRHAGQHQRLHPHHVG